MCTPVSIISIKFVLIYLELSFYFFFQLGVSVTKLLLKLCVLCLLSDVCVLEYLWDCYFFYQELKKLADQIAMERRQHDVQQQRHVAVIGNLQKTLQVSVVYIHRLCSIIGLIVT
jgi:hypothetical protein